MKKILFVVFLSFLQTLAIASPTEKTKSKVVKKTAMQELKRKDLAPIKAIKKTKTLKVDAKNYYDVPGTDEFTRPN